MYKVEIQSEQIAQEAIARRKRLDAERKERIFNPKVRILGVDLNALDEQIHLKNELKSMEQARSDTLDHQTMLNNEILEMMDKQVHEAKRQQMIEINRFREEHQRAFQRRDFDLYDPRALKNDYPARVSDNDPRIGVSSLQRFEGEDLAVLKREALQKEQMRIWTQQQLFEKQQQQLSQKTEKEKYENFQANINAKLEALQLATENAQREQNKLDKEYNIALAEEKRRREQMQKAYETELNTREIINTMNGREFVENKTDQYKGLSEEQKLEILKANEVRREEHRKRKQAQEDLEAQWNVKEMAMRHALELLERQKQRDARDNAKRIQFENQQKAQEDKLK